MTIRQSLAALNPVDEQTLDHNSQTEKGLHSPQRGFLCEGVERLTSLEESPALADMLLGAEMEVYRDLGIRCYTEAGDLKRALKYLSIGLELAPDDPVGRFHRSIVLQRLGQYAEASHDLVRLTRTFPNHHRGWRRLGQLRRFGLDDLAGALEAFQNALRLRSRDAQVLRGLAAVCHRLRDIEAAGEHHRRLLALPDHTADDVRAYAMFLLREHGEAARACQLLLQVIGTDPPSHDQAGELVETVERLLPCRSEDDRTLVLDVGRRLTMVPGHDDRRTAAIVGLLASGGEIERALEHADRALSVLGRTETLRMVRAALGLNRACALFEAGQTELALDDFHYAIELRAGKRSRGAIAAFSQTVETGAPARIVVALNDHLAPGAAAQCIRDLVALDQQSGPTMLRLLNAGPAATAHALMLNAYSTMLSALSVKSWELMLAAAIRNFQTAPLRERVALLRDVANLLTQLDVPGTLAKPLPSLPGLRRQVRTAQIAALVALGQRDGAVVQLRRWLAMEPANIQALRLLADTLPDAARDPDLETLCLRALESDATASEGAALLARFGRADTALASLCRRVQTKPTAKSVSLVGRLAAYLDQPGPARACYSMLLSDQMLRERLAPQVMAEAQLALGHSDDALETLRMAAAADPGCGLAHVGALLHMGQVEAADAAFSVLIEQLAAAEEPDWPMVGQLLAQGLQLEVLLKNMGRDLAALVQLEKWLWPRADAALARQLTTKARAPVLAAVERLVRLLTYCGLGDGGARMLAERIEVLATTPEEAMIFARCLNAAYRPEARVFAERAVAALLRRSPELTASETAADHLPSGGNVILAMEAADALADESGLRRFAALGAAVLQEAIASGNSGTAAMVRLAVRLGTLSSHHHALALGALEGALETLPNDIALLRARQTLLQATGRSAVSMAERACALKPLDASAHAALAGLRFAEGELDGARAALAVAERVARHELRSDLSNAAAQSQLAKIESERQTGDFWAETSVIFQRAAVRRAGKLRGVVVMSSYGCLMSTCLAALPLAELRQRGYEVVFLSADGPALEPTGDSGLDAFRGIFINGNLGLKSVEIHRRDTFFDWSVDWPNRRVEALGMNFYQPLYEQIGRILRRYRFDLNAPGVQRHLDTAIRGLDRALHVCEGLRDEVAARGIPVRFVTANWQYPPYAAYRLWCDEIGHRHDMQFVAVGPGYENYYSNLGSRFGQSCAMVNMTVHRKTRAPYIAVESEFNSWYDAARAHGQTFEDEARAWVQTKRSRAEGDSPETNAVVERVERHRAAGGKVVGLFGKIVYDLTVPYTGGPAHRDMADFLNHAIVSAAAAPDTLLLVKPHPHELRWEIAGKPNEYFLDMIDVPVPDNVILLGHRWFNMLDMISLIDLGVLWNGTTGLELGASGIPVVMCDDWGINDYPVGHRAPRDRDDFARIVRDPGSVTMDPDHRYRCAALLKYMSTEHVMRPYPYAQRGILNVSVGAPVWNRKEVERYFANGDLHVQALADRLLLSA